MNIDIDKVWNAFLEKGIVLDPSEFKEQLQSLIDGGCKGDRIVWGCKGNNPDKQIEYTIYFSEDALYLVQVRAYIDLKNCQL